MNKIDEIMSKAEDKRKPFAASPEIRVTIKSVRGAWMTKLHDLLSTAASSITIHLEPGRMGGLDVTLITNRSDWDRMIMIHRKNRR